MKYGIGFAAVVGAAVLVLAGWTTNPQQTTAVDLGAGPYLDSGPWQLARDLGLDEEQELNLKLRVIPSALDVTRQVLRGSLDMGYSCYACMAPVMKQYPTQQAFMLMTQFTGYIIVGRKGQTETYGQLVKRLGPAKAKQRVLRSLLGKSFAVAAVTYAPVIQGALKAAGLPADGVKFIEFPNDAQAALAFLGGTGDYFLGSLPQEVKLLVDHKDKFVAVGGNELLGAAGLFYVDVIADKSYLEENKEIALRVMAVWYRAMRYVNERPAVAVPILRKFLNKEAAASFSDKQVAFLINRFVRFPTIQYARAHAFNKKDKRLYWKNSAAYFFGQNKKVLPAGFRFQSVLLEEQYFNELLQRKDLMRVVNGPLK